MGLQPMGSKTTDPNAELVNLTLRDAVPDLRVRKPNRPAPAPRHTAP